MKKLNGMKSFSSLENKKLEGENLEGVAGGRARNASPKSLLIS